MVLLLYRYIELKEKRKIKMKTTLTKDTLIEGEIILKGVEVIIENQDTKSKLLEKSADDFSKKVGWTISGKEEALEQTQNDLKLLNRYKNPSFSEVERMDSDQWEDTVEEESLTQIFSFYDPTDTFVRDRISIWRSSTGKIYGVNSLVSSSGPDYDVYS